MFVMFYKNWYFVFLAAPPPRYHELPLGQESIVLRPSEERMDLVQDGEDINPMVFPRGKSITYVKSKFSEGYPSLGFSSKFLIQTATSFVTDGRWAFCQIPTYRSIGDNRSHFLYQFRPIQPWHLEKHNTRARLLPMKFLKFSSSNNLDSKAIIIACFIEN